MKQLLQVIIRTSIKVLLERAMYISLRLNMKYVVYGSFLRCSFPVPDTSVQFDFTDISAANQGTDQFLLVN
jgi:hypothetical protein